METVLQELANFRLSLLARSLSFLLSCSIRGMGFDTCKVPLIQTSAGPWGIKFLNNLGFFV